MRHMYLVRFLFISWLSNIERIYHVRPSMVTCVPVFNVTRKGEEIDMNTRNLAICDPKLQIFTFILQKFLPQVLNDFKFVPSSIFDPLQHTTGFLASHWNSCFILFTISNGDLDPWSAYGVLDNADVPHCNVIRIPSGAHHLDLRAANDADPEDVKNARASQMEIIQKWISQWEFFPNLGVRKPGKSSRSFRDVFVYLISVVRPNPRWLFPSYAPPHPHPKYPSPSYHPTRLVPSWSLFDPVFQYITNICCPILFRSLISFCQFTTPDPFHFLSSSNYSYASSTAP